jgi:hypothetical protein
MNIFMLPALLLLLGNNGDAPLFCSTSVEQCPIELKSVQGSDTTDDDSSHTAKYKKVNLYKRTIKSAMRLPKFAFKRLVPPIPPAFLQSSQFL